MQDFKGNVSYVGDDESIVVLTVLGSYTSVTYLSMEKSLEEQLALKKYKIIVDLKGVNYVTTAFWGVVVSEIREIRENNGDLVLVNMPPDVYEVYEIMEFSSILKSYNSLNEAIAYFSGDSGEEPGALKPAIKKPPPKPPPALVQSRKPEQAPAYEKEQDVYSRASSELGKRIINVIVDNPYSEPKDISKALKLPQYGGKKAGIEAVKKELKAMGLFDRQQRIELAM